MRVSDLGDAGKTSCRGSYLLTIVRVKNELLDIEVIQFGLIDSLLNPGSEGDPTLNVADQI